MKVKGWAKSGLNLPEELSDNGVSVSFAGMVVLMSTNLISNHCILGRNAGVGTLLIWSSMKIHLD